MDDPKVQLRRLVEALDEVPPTDEEAHALCEAMGIDIEAVRARILALVVAHEAGAIAEEEAPRSHLRERSTLGDVGGPAGAGKAPRPGRERKSDPHGRRAR